jgi:hypothetical protein
MGSSLPLGSIGIVVGSVGFSQLEDAVGTIVGSSIIGEHETVVTGVQQQRRCLAGAASTPTTQWTPPSSHRTTHQGLARLGPSAIPEGRGRHPVADLAADFGRRTVHERSQLLSHTADCRGTGDSDSLHDRPTGGCGWLGGG